jgi:hypothetical protein
MVYVFADEDTYVDAKYPGTKFGSLDYLWLRRASESQWTQRNMLLHFPIEALLPPGTNIYQATLMFDVLNTEGEASPYWRTAMIFTLEDPFDESTTDWFNQPGMVSWQGSMDVSPSTGWHTADLTDLVRDWYSGVEPNYGIGIVAAVPLTDSYAIRYQSRNVSNAGYRPRLEIECGDDLTTVTPTPEPSPTRTPTATPTVSPTPVPETGNVVAWHLGVTQGVQTLQHTVPLLEGKHTYVRLAYVLENPVPNYTYNTNAKLYVYRGGYHVDTLLPINNPTGYLELITANWYQFPNTSFIFELPTEYTTGETRLRGVIDPGTDLPESNVMDNSIERTVTFEPVQPYNINYYLVKHTAANGTVTQAQYNDIPPSWDYAMASLPFAAVNGQLRFLDWDEATMGQMTCEGVNGLLMSQWLAEGHSWTDLYYAFMPGNGVSCAESIPATVASSWTGSSRSTMAHELGHCFGRHHTQDPRYDDGGSNFDIGCGASTGCWYSPTWWGLYGCHPGFEEYPYANGALSPAPFIVYGFYRNNWTLSGTDGYWTSDFFVPYHTWKDLMTYCKPERWPSDFTWQRIYDDWFSLSVQRASALEQTGQITPTDSLVVVGTIVSSTGAVDLQRLYVLPDVTWAPEPEPGDFAIVLRDAVNGELLRHEFAPGLVDVPDFGNVLSMGELVPYFDGTVRVDIEGPTGVLATVVSGATPPTVTIVRPNGGETASGNTILVSWTADDPDGDLLSYSVQYSDDDGATWTLLASDVFTTGVWVNTQNMPASTHGRIRVLASDGIHTTADVSDGPFTVPNHRPNVMILSPRDSAIYIVSQTVGLEAQVFDVEDGTLDPTHLRWHSNLDGVVGYGAQVSIANLSAGLHTIVLVAVDGGGATNVDAVQIQVYAGPDDLPPLPDVLQAEPAMVVLDPLMGGSSQPIYLYNQTNPDPISWTAQASEPWVHLSSTSGTTAEMITVWARTFSLPEGRYTATVTFTDAADPDNSATVHLSVTARRFSIYLPLVMRATSSR